MTCPRVSQKNQLNPAQVSPSDALLRDVVDRLVQQMEKGPARAVPEATDRLASTVRLSLNPARRHE